MNKGAFEAFRDSLLIAALAALGLLCLHTVREPASGAAPQPPGLDLQAISSIVVHDSSCPNADRDYHFVIGNGVLHADGEIVTTDAWRKQKTCPGLRDEARARATVSVALVTAGAERPTPAQERALQRLAKFLEGSCGVESPEIVAHDAVDPDGCAVVHARR